MASRNGSKLNKIQVDRIENRNDDLLNIEVGKALLGDDFFDNTDPLSFVQRQDLDNYFNADNPGLGDGVVTPGTISIDGTYLATFGSPFTYRINNVLYTPAETTLQLLPPDPTYTRVDIIVGNQSGHYEKVEGVAASTYAIPDVPPGKLLLSQIYRLPDGSNIIIINDKDGYLLKVGDTMLGSFTVANGNDIVLRAAVGPTGPNQVGRDSGDIVFQWGTGYEWRRLYVNHATGDLTFKEDQDFSKAYVILNSKNFTTYVIDDLNISLLKTFSSQEIVNRLSQIGANNAAKYYEKVRLGASVTIACEGTSITYGQDGSGPTPGINGSPNTRSLYPYPETMASVLTSIGIVNTVINRGYPGDQTADWFTRWGTADAVDAVVIEYGANDANNYGGKPSGIIDIVTFKANMILIIKKHLLQGAYTLLSLPTSDPTYANELKVRLYGQVIQELADQFNLPIINPKQIMAWVGNIYLTKTSPHLNSTALAEWGSQAAAYFTDRGETPFKVTGSEKYSAYSGLVGSYGESIALGTSIYGNYINIPANGYRYIVIDVKQRVTMYLKVRSASGTRTLTVTYGNNISKTDQVISVTTATVRQNCLTLDEGIRLVILKGGSSAPYIDEVGFDYNSQERLGIGTTNPTGGLELADTTLGTYLRAFVSGDLRWYRTGSVIAPLNRKVFGVQHTDNAAGTIWTLLSRTDADGFQAALVNATHDGFWAFGKASGNMEADGSIVALYPGAGLSHFSGRSRSGAVTMPVGEELFRMKIANLLTTSGVTNNLGVEVASWRVVTSQIQSLTAMGNYQVWFLTPINTIVQREAMRIEEGGLTVVGKGTFSGAPTNANDVIRKQDFDATYIAVANTTDVITQAFMNTTYPNVPIRGIVDYYNQGLECRRVTATIWTFKATNILS